MSRRSKTIAAAVTMLALACGSQSSDKIDAGSPVAAAGAARRGREAAA